MGSIYHSSPKSDNQRWSEILWRKQIPGYCKKCYHRGSALWTIYGDGTESIRCANCKETGFFMIDISAFNDPDLFPPFMTDWDIQQAKEAWESRYTKGQR